VLILSAIFSLNWKFLIRKSLVTLAQIEAAETMGNLESAFSATVKVRFYFFCEKSY
jgi:hypothetical protein